MNLPSRFVCTVALGLALAGCAATPSDAPLADDSAGSRALKKLPRKTGERVAVTIYEFRSTLPALSSTTATDMFKTALVQSGQFRVVERLRVNEGIARERQVQAEGHATGAAAAKKLRGAQYVFEGVVSEANSGENQRSAGIGIAGMRVGGGSARDSIAIDVRIVDAGTGDLIDAVTVKKTIKADEASVSGVDSLLNTVLARRNKYSAYTPDVQAQQRRGEGVDSALRAAIDQAVLQLAQRFEP